MTEHLKKRFDELLSQADAVVATKQRKHASMQRYTRAIDVLNSVKRIVRDWWRLPSWAGRSRMPCPKLSN